MRVLVILLIGIVMAGVFFLTYDTAHAPVENQVAAVQATTTASAEEEYTGPTFRVLKVIDGDTLAMDMNGNSVTVRLIGLDTPETSDPRKPVQCFGREASAKAKELLTGAYISIEQDESQGAFDKYNRILAYVYLPDGTLFNKYMISEGYGHEYTYNLPYKYQSEFKAAETEAREQKKGLWADDACARESERTSTPAKLVTPAPSGNYQCTTNIYNCSSFKTQSEAQAAFDSCGGSSNDVHKLDSDKDGVVCESLP